MRHVVVGTAGHIDHGKSALVQALTGVDPDRLQEEKVRGITIDLGFAHYSLDDVNMAFVDVPGHERFVRNMLAGASGIDAVLLVVAANESVMPQTREHFDICRLLGVTTGVVALTKCDLVDSEMLELVQLEVRELLAGTPLADAPLVDVSARSGVGLDRLRAALHDVAGALPTRAADGAARLPVDRVFTVRGFGTVVTGTLGAGTLGLDMDLDVLPAGRRVRVRGLQVHGRQEQAAGPGQRVAVNLQGVEVADLRRGDTLVERGSLETTRRFDAALTVLGSARPLRHGARVRCHHGTAEAMARVSVCGPTTMAVDTDEPAFPNALEPGAEAFVRVRLEEPLALTRGDRFVLRAYSPPITIAGGQVLDPQPPRGRLRSPRGVFRLQRLGAPGGLGAVVAAMVEEGAGRGVSRAALVPRLGVGAAVLDRAVARMAAAGQVAVVGELLVAPDELDTVRRRLLQLVSEFHAAHPLEPGLSREEARERLGERAAVAVFDQVVADLVAECVLVATDHLALASHEVALSAAETRARDRLAGLFHASGLMPPGPGSVATAAGVSADLAERLLKLLVREGTLVKVETLFFHAEHLSRLRADVTGLKAAADGPVRIDVGMFKERFGVTRKYAIPLLGYLDRERITRRVGDARLVL